MSSILDLGYENLIGKFWSEQEGICKQHTEHFILPTKIDRDEKGVYSYWWHAHELDYLVDVYKRTKDKKILEKIDSVIVNNIRLNGNTILNEFYDDMLWNAIAILRIYEVTRKYEYKSYVMTLWDDIKKAYNECCGGGMAWRKDMLWYKNTPANCPTVILGVRLFTLFGNESDLALAKNVLDWQIENLYEKSTGEVIDGMNRLNDMEKDTDWRFTYCQGVFVGACLEISKYFKDDDYLKYADKTIESLKDIYLDESLVFKPEGADDIGLFKGILSRYLSEYYLYTQNTMAFDILKSNYNALSSSLESEKLFSDNFKESKINVELPEYLSAVITLEAYDRAEKGGK